MESKRKFVQIVPVALIAIVVFTIVITSTALAANWDGTWYNKDTATKGMVKFTIKDETFHGYGSCTPTPCDWGTAPLIFYSKSVTDTNNVAAIAQYNFGFSKSVIILNMNSPTLIKASQYSQFTDGSGRHNYFSKDMQFVTLKLTAPKQTSPKSGSVFSIYPRTTTLKWKPVSGAASYTVEIDCYHCCQANKWCTDVGKTWQIVPGITTTSYTFDFVGAQPGRWRVWAVDEDGKAGPKSGWWTFTYKI